MGSPDTALLLHVLLAFLPWGLTAIKCSGHVWVEPAPVVPMGCNVSINCLSTVRCPRATHSILLNYTQAAGELRALNSSTFQLRLPPLRVPSWVVTCVARCPNSPRRQLVCGTQVFAGYPPESPGNLSCVVHELSERLECTWDAGRDTHLPTHYTLHLQSARMQEAAVFVVGPALTVPLSELRGGSLYAAWLEASNALGTARSAPQQLDLQHIVIPAAPAVAGVEGAEAARTLVRWERRTRQREVRCEERYGPPGAAAWQVRAWAGGAGPRTGYALESGARYAFQARCRLSRPGSPWSAWSSPFLYSTPEAAPAAAPDVWRRLGALYPNGSREVTVLIEPLPPRVARGTILGYAVWAQSGGAARPLCNSSAPACRLLLPRGVGALAVAAYNSRGASGPASLAVDSGAGLPGPGAVHVQREGPRHVAVSWQRPPPGAAPLLWFILECLSTVPHGSEQRFFWKKVPKQETRAYLQEEAAAGSRIEVSVYAVYPDGVSKPGSGYDDDVGVFLGLGVSVIVLSVVFIILMFKKSARKRITRIIASLRPKWLLEDFPHVENSNVIKSLQGKSGFTHSSFDEPPLNNSDPMILEIEELSVHEERKLMDVRKNPSEAAPAGTTCAQSPALAAHVATEPISDYRPQLSDGNLLGYVAANLYQSQPHALPPEPETNAFFRDYPSPVTYLWNAEGMEQQAFLLEKINLILNNNRSGQNHAFDSAREEQNTLLENQWEKTLSSEDAQEQTLVPDELVSCLRTMNEERADIQICFPQSTRGLF
ncbi:interleukin-23 receptor [Eudromia elegans]